MSYHHGNLRQDLLHCAAEVIARDGIEALSLRALARDLGVSHAAPARHFKDKTALLAALAEDSFDAVIKALDEATEAAGPDPMARYNAIGKALVHFALDNPAYYHAMSHPEIRQQPTEALLAAHTAYMDRLLDAAVKAQAAGWLPDVSPQTAVLYSTAAASGAAQMLLNTHDTRLLEGRDPKTIGDQIIDLVVAPQSKPAKRGRK